MVQNGRQTQDRQRSIIQGSVTRYRTVGKLSAGRMIKTGETGTRQKKQEYGKNTDRRDKTN
jgi:hypothetical protein